MSSGSDTPDGKSRRGAREASDGKPAKRKRRRRATLNDWPTMELTPPAGAVPKGQAKKPAAGAISRGAGKLPPLRPPAGTKGKGAGLFSTPSRSALLRDDKEKSKEHSFSLKLRLPNRPDTAPDMPDTAPDMPDTAPDTSPASFGSGQAPSGDRTSSRAATLDDDWTLNDLDPADDDWVSGPTTPGPAKIKDFGFEPTFDPKTHAPHIALEDGELEFGPAGLDVPAVLIDEDNNLGADDGDLPTSELRLGELGLSADARPAKSGKELGRLASAMIREAESELAEGSAGKAVKVLARAFERGPDSDVAQRLIEQHADAMIEIYQRYIGDAEAVPVLAVGLEQLVQTNLDSRAAFLLTRIDGVMSIDELLDVAGMPRVDALRYLAGMLIDGIVKRE